MLYLLATAKGESPAFTTYLDSAPTALTGSVVVVPGKVLFTGGIVAKLVGVTLTTVVATPSVSPPHAPPRTEATATSPVAVMSRVLDSRRKDNTIYNSRASRHQKSVASLFWPGVFQTRGRAVGGMGEGRELSPIK